MHCRWGRRGPFASALSFLAALALVDFFQNGLVNSNREGNGAEPLLPQQQSMSSESVSDVQKEVNTKIDGLEAGKREGGHVKRRKKSWGDLVVSSEMISIEDPQLLSFSREFATNALRVGDVDERVMSGRVHELKPECDDKCTEQVEMEMKKRLEKAEILLKSCEDMPLKWDEWEAAPSIVAVAGWPSDEQSQEFKEEDEIRSSLVTLLTSIAEHTEGSVNVILITNPVGVENILSLWRDHAEYAKNRIKLDIIIIDIFRLLIEAQNKIKYGLVTPCVYRLWQLPKIWIGQLVPNQLRRIMLIDLDVLVNADIGMMFHTWRHTWLQAKSKNAAECLAIGAVPEVTNTMFEHVDFADAPDRYANTGVMLIDVDLLFELEFYETLIDTSIYWRSSPRHFNQHGQWPPEQWIFNAIFAQFQQLVYPLHRFWNLNCLHQVYFDRNNLLGKSMLYSEDDFERDKRAAFLHHYCGSSVIQDFDLGHTHN